MVDRIQQDVTGDLTKEEQEREDKLAKAGDAVSIRGRVSKDGERVDIAADPDTAPPQPNEQLASTRPEHVPEKFWNEEKSEVNVDALLKSEKDAQAEITRLRQDNSDDNSDSSNSADENTDNSDSESTDGDQNDAIAAARAEYAEKGELTDDTYVALAKQGITKDMVKAYIAGQGAAVAEVQQAAFSAAGSEEDYRKMQQWASENLSDEDISVLDTLLTSSDPKVVARGAAQLAERFNAEADIDPTVTVHGESNNTTGATYKSSQEMQKDMRDPRYKKDPAFRAEVEAKLARTDEKVLFGRQ